jgi:predicted Zn-dependent protease
MSQSRIDAFRSLLEEQPDEAVVWYGLATEYIKLENWTDATNALQNVIRCNPDYTAAYQMLGSAFQSQGKADEARRVWTEGIAVATKMGAWNARGHMEKLLSQSEVASASPNQSSSKFCSEP